MGIWRKTAMHDQYCKAHCHRQAGLTLVELMIAIGIIAILATIAVPNIINWLPNYRAKAAARDIISNFQKAKMEAVKRNRDVVITFTTTQAGSYRIFVDDDGDGNFTAGERVLAQVNMPKDVFLYNTTFTGDKTGYNSRGLPWNNRLGSVEIRNNKLIIRATRYYQATLSFAGHVKLQMSIDGATWN
jgi:type IV fimbrial biogenesis protein FimT